MCVFILSVLSKVNEEAARPMTLVSGPHTVAVVYLLTVLVSSGGIPVCCCIPQQGLVRHGPEAGTGWVSSMAVTSDKMIRSFSLNYPVGGGGDPFLTPATTAV